MSTKITNWGAEAAAMIKEYQSDPLHIPTVGNKKLKGWMADAEHVLEILNNEDHEIAKLFMILGMKTVDGQKQVNLVFVGVDGNGKMVLDPAYDYLDPCPADCADLSSHL